MPIACKHALCSVCFSPTALSMPCKWEDMLALCFSAANEMCRRVKMTRLRARVAERLKGAQNTYAMLTTFNEIDMTNLMKLRSDYKVCRDKKEHQKDISWTEAVLSAALS